MEKKLTYYQICQLADNGSFAATPDGYNIIWSNGIPPHTVFDKRIESASIEFVRNDFAMPDYMKVVGKYVVHVPDLYGEVSEGYFFKELEYGDVFLQTYFELSGIKFVYCSEDSADCIKPYIMNFTEYVTGRTGYKKDFTFDVKFSMDAGVGHLESLMPANIIFPVLDQSGNETPETAVEFTYGHYYWTPE